MWPFSVVCVAGGSFGRVFFCGFERKRFSLAKAEPRTVKKTTGEGRGEKARLGFESKQALFSRLSFCNSISCVFNCDDLLGRSVISSPRSSKWTEAVGVFAYQTYSVFHVPRLLFVRQHMVLIGCAQRLCMRDYL